MSTNTINPQPRTAWLDVGLSIVGVAALVAVVMLSRALATDVGDALTRNTVRVSLSWYAVALCAMMRMRPTDWDATTPTGRFARDCWSWAVISFLVHLAMAFHYYHHWSPAHAFERTRQLSGIGEGIYVSYLFTVLWAADVIYWWVRPREYAARSPWIGRLLHAFMLFIVFNGMVIYESGPIRWAGLIGTAVLGLVWLATRPRRVAAVAAQLG